MTGCFRMTGWGVWRIRAIDACPVAPEDGTGVICGRD